MADYSAIKMAGGGLEKRELFCTVDENVHLEIWLYQAGVPMW